MHGRRIEVRRYPTIASLGSCQVLFCSAQDMDRLREQHPQPMGARPVLTVGQQEEFFSGGGILMLPFKEEHLAFAQRIRH